ncbi:MAG TPA: hypothetical protein VND65_20670 [Candidatus Binatia bacterium]|nr:hypothetical protein [Candidatus Binatia bacterium]
MTLFSPRLAMATTQLVCAIDYEETTSWTFDKADREPALHMNWIVATDGEGTARLRMHWAPAENLDR